MAGQYSISQGSADEEQYEELETHSNEKNHGLKTKRRPFTKLFLEKWLNEPMFAEWLAEIESFPDRCYCKVCEVVLMAGHSELEKHATGRKHCMRIEEKRLANEKNSQESQQVVKLQGNYLLNDANPTPTFRVEGISRKPKSESILLKGLKRASSNPPKQNGPTVFRSVRQEQSTKKRRLYDDDNVPRRSNVPENPDVRKLLRLIRSETGSDSDGDLDLEEDEDVSLESSEQLLKQLKAAPDYREETAAQHNVDNSDEMINGGTMAEKELEARLLMVQEERRHKQKIYKLQLLEMQAKVKLAEEQLRRSGELHNLRTAQLQLQINRENEFVSTTDPSYDETSQQ